MKFAGFFVGFLVLLTSATFYVHRRTATAFHLSERGRRVLAVVLVSGLPAMLTARFLARALPWGIGLQVAVAGSAIALGVVIAALLLLVVDAVRGLADLATRAVETRSPRSAGGPDGPPAAPPPGEPAPAAGPDAPVPRRAFLGRAAAGSALLVGGSSSLYGALVGRHDYVIEEVVIRVPGLSRALDGYTLVQISDLHIGQFVGEPELAAAESLLRRARPDAIVLTGDMLDHDLQFAEMLGRFVRRLDGVARAGLFAIPGNHDHYAGLEGTLAAVERGGGQVLLNSGRSIGDAGGAFALLGVDDVWGARADAGAGPDLARAIASVPPDLPRILLAHNPVYFAESATDVALQLSGHTHGGQVNLLVRPAALLLPYGYIAGRYTRGGAQLYVNRGFGTAGPPARIGSAPEVTRIVLVAG